MAPLHTGQLGAAAVPVLQRGADTGARGADGCHVGRQVVHLRLHVPEIYFHLPDGVWGTRAKCQVPRLSGTTPHPTQD